MASSARPLLWSYWRSSCSWRVRIALNLKGVNYEIRTIDMIGHEQNTAEFESKCGTPFSLVPVFVHNGMSINESLAIIEYLEEKFPGGKSLLPGSAEDRARIRALSLQIIANTQPLQNLRVLEYHSAEPEKRKDWAKHWINHSFAALEKALSKTAGKFAYGDEVSLLDVCLPPQCFNARRFGVDLSKFPTISRLDAEIPEGRWLIFRRIPPNSRNRRIPEGRCFPPARHSRRVPKAMKNVKQLFKFSRKRKEF